MARFQSAKVSRPEDDNGAPDPARVYAISCFFVRPGHRRRGTMGELAAAAVAFARAAGAAAVEACPIEFDRPLVWGDGFHGSVETFRHLGFREIARRSPRRPLMRIDLG
jgi:GNAT superfamily N-acetyltransferase